MADKDIISKEILKSLALDMAKVLFKLQVTSTEIIETEHQRVEERRADLIAKVKEKGEESIIHVEIQNNNQKRMPWRMLRYLTDIKDSYPEMEIRQYLIYIGKDMLTMPNGIQQKRLSYSYEIVDMHDVDCQSLIEQDTPDALALAILCDFKDKPERDIVRLLLKRLHKLVAGNETQFRKYLYMMEVLSTNRNLKQIIKEEEKMLSQVKYSELPSYEIGWECGMEKGMQKGIEKGMQTGMQKGMEKGERVLLHRLITKRFGGIPENLQEKINSATSSQLEEWADKMIRAETIEDIF
jgi:predicted transposase/invertase (TIGR01784 family)